MVSQMACSFALLGAATVTLVLFGRAVDDVGDLPSAPAAARVLGVWVVALFALAGLVLGL